MTGRRTVPEVVSRILGVDPGRRRIGLALSDDVAGTVALPFMVVEREGGNLIAAGQIRAAIQGERVEKIVMGLPLRLSGGEGISARRVRRFGTELATALDCPIAYWDERMSTLAAEAALRSMGVHGTRQRRVVDSTAATLILQSYLDAGGQGAL